MVSKKVMIPSDASQGSVIGLFLFLVMVNDLPNDQQLFRQFFTDDRKIGGKSGDVDMI